MISIQGIDHINLYIVDPDGHEIELTETLGGGL